MRRNLFVAVLILGFPWIGPPKVRAEKEVKKAIEETIEVLVQLDGAWSVVDHDSISLKKYEIQLQKGAERLFAVANATADNHPELAEAVGLCGKLIVDSAFTIFTGLEEHNEAVAIIKAHERLVSVLPNVFLGVVVYLMPSSENQSGRLSEKETTALMKAVAQGFGDRIQGPDTINGGNAFVRSASLLHGLFAASLK